MNTELSESIKRNKDSIIQLWEKRVRHSGLAVSDKQTPALVDSLPDTLEQMAAALSARPVEDEVLKKHGEHRAHLDEYTIDQVIEEYNILNKVILEIVDPEEKFTRRQLDHLSDFIFRIVKATAHAFTENRESEKVKLHETLLESNQTNFNTIIDAVEDYAIFSVDLNGVIMTWNAGAERMKEYTPKEAIGSHFSMLYSEEGQRMNEPMDHLKAAAVEGRFRGEGIRRKKSGETFIADVYIIPVKKDDVVIGYAKIVEDLTEHNRLVQERDISINEVENLKEESDLRETFVATLTHDLRNPLAAAKMSAQLVQKNPTNYEKVVTLSTKIVNHITRTEKLISNLLDANKIHAGEKLLIHRSECNLRKIVEEVIDELTTTHGHKIIIKGPEEVTGLWDHEGLRRVIENLIGNAIKYGYTYTPITLTLSTILNKAMLRVHNYGDAIELPDQLLLFKKFQRTRSAQRSGKAGWGLGLTVVKGIIDAHGGNVKIESYPKEGTTFTITLPN